MGGLDYGSQKRALFRKKYNAILNFGRFRIGPISDSKSAKFSKEFYLHYFINWKLRC